MKVLAKNKQLANPSGYLDMVSFLDKALVPYLKQTMLSSYVFLQIQYLLSGKMHVHSHINWVS